MGAGSVNDCEQPQRLARGYASSSRGTANGEWRMVRSHSISVSSEVAEETRTVPREHQRWIKIASALANAFSAGVQLADLPFSGHGVHADSRTSASPWERAAGNGPPSTTSENGSPRSVRGPREHPFRPAAGRTVGFG